MANRSDAVRGREIIARWCALTERRLDHLTELYETGRWRRYHSELAFLANIREAKAAVETWRDLLRREASRDNSAVDFSWLGRPRSTLPSGVPLRGVVCRPEREIAALSIVPPLQKVAVEAHPERDRSPAIVPAMEAPAPGVGPLRTLDSAAIQERYPLLRNAL